LILSDRDIRGLLALGELVVEPLRPDTVRENGLDLRLSREFCRLRSTGRVLDPREPGDPGEFYECFESDSVVVEPNGRLLAVTEEYVALPPYLAGLVNLRSTWARTGLWVPPTVVDAGFRGQIVVEIVGSSFPVKLYPGDRFLHLVLVRLATPAERPYTGEYQGQRGVRLPKFFPRQTGG
jgi:dCTP deaminase